MRSKMMSVKWTPFRSELNVLISDNQCEILGGLPIDRWATSMRNEVIRHDRNVSSWATTDPLYIHQYDIHKRISRQFL